MRPNRVARQDKDLERPSGLVAMRQAQHLDHAGADRNVLPMD